jgi:hypothetical protein
LVLKRTPRRPVQKGRSAVGGFVAAERFVERVRHLTGMVVLEAAVVRSETWVRSASPVSTW